MKYVFIYFVLSIATGNILKICVYKIMVIALGETFFNNKVGYRSVVSKSEIKFF